MILTNTICLFLGYGGVFFLCLVVFFCIKLVSCFLAVSSFGGNHLIFRLLRIARNSVSFIQSFSSEFESANKLKSRSYFNIILTADTFPFHTDTISCHILRACVVGKYLNIYFQAWSLLLYLICPLYFPIVFCSLKYVQIVYDFI